MKILFALMICMMSFAQASHAETLSKDKFLAPGSEKTDLRAPINDASKMPGVANPADGPTAPGGKAPITPVNGVCPTSYHCSSSGDRCLPNLNDRQIIGPEVCSNVLRLCRLYREAIARGEKLDESDSQKFAYYCN